jgi:hypothetical protein
MIDLTQKKKKEHIISENEEVPRSVLGDWKKLSQLAKFTILFFVCFWPVVILISIFDTRESSQPQPTSNTPVQTQPTECLNQVTEWYTTTMQEYADKKYDYRGPAEGLLPSIIESEKEKRVEECYK